MDAGTLHVTGSQEPSEPACAEYFKQQHPVCKEGIMKDKVLKQDRPQFQLGVIVATPGAMY
ncbi:MAG TPA: hypothetical protein PKA06_14470, partial [Gemmatales bacterium]|nr:hypothetical protein [Gemmatales bacterium]